MEQDILAFGQDLIAAQPRLRTSALGLAKHPEKASKLVRETMNDAWRRRDAYRPGQNLDDWLDGILRDRLGEPRSFAPR